jgi:hypothetical protein
MALFLPLAAKADNCEICEDVVTEFNPGNTPWLGEVELGLSNTIRIVGYESHGLKSISISCEMLCGMLNQPCCFEVATNKWKCSYDYLYCDQQNENGVCLVDSSPPNVTVQGIPANAIAPAQGCSSFLTTPAKAYVTCTDSHTGCLNGSEKILVYYFGQSVPAQCPSSPTDYDYQYYPASQFNVVEHAYVCGAATDKAENPGFSQKPIEFCVDTDNPVPPSLWYKNVGGNFIDLVWYQSPLNADFDHYELYYSNRSGFPLTPGTLYGKYTTQNVENNVRIENLRTETMYCFRVLVFDKSSPVPLNASSGEMCVETVQCNSGDKIKCFADGSGVHYGSFVDQLIKGVCKPGNATCSNGFWSYCENQTGPFMETCDGLDEDCDGYTDNEFTGYAQLLSKPCNAPGGCGWGIIQCVGGEWENETTECSSLEYASTEICNGVDDDCNGVIDDVDGGSSIGSTKCACYGGGARLPYELCNGIDDDCNDWVNPHEGLDDVYEPQSCACYMGAYAPGQLQEKCNMVDDDCNTLVDDPWLGILGSWWPLAGVPCGYAGTPCEGGFWECNATNDGVVCSTQKYAQQESCSDEIDNDCDGTINDGCDCTPPGSYRTCGKDVGECRNGTQYCEAGLWGMCLNAINPAAETCDGKDNDCDGIVDNVNNGSSIAATQCRCYNKGTPTAEKCNAIDDNCNGVIDDVTNPATCLCYKGGKPGQEICNGIDDDCDETIDDGWPDLGTVCGYGICSGGKMVCSTSGNHTVCSTTSSSGMGNATDKRKAETCNSADDDCDGIIDNVEGKLSVEETLCGCYGGGNKKQETCNHIDDDCDEKIDEDLFCVCFSGQSKPCGSSIGECELGRAQCADGTWGKCEGGKGSSKEVCNMKDDNCDGVADNVNDGYSVEATQCGCYNGRKPSIEICDGIDNDCNGAVDDDIDCRCEEGQEMQCGSNVGECMPGVKRCVNGKWGECSGGVLPGPETCNGKDDDCNGVVDDVNGGSSIGSTRCACYNNFAKAGTQTEIANDIDDDCDGRVDEGFITEEPKHCQNDIKDSDEEGIDCGGSCKEVCPEAPAPLSTWLVVFAALAAVIAIFGIFFSSFRKGEKKSLFERMK